LRDDAASIVAGLVRFHGIKLQLLNKLLLSESDKLHYCKSGNLEKVIELIESDSGIIDDIDAADFDISQAEASLATLIGVRTPALYETLRGSGEAGELMELRGQAAEALGRLFKERAELDSMLGSASRELQESIDALSRLRRLKDSDAGVDGLPR
jgi:hypothetical protein